MEITQTTKEQRAAVAAHLVDHLTYNLGEVLGFDGHAAVKDAAPHWTPRDGVALIVTLPTGEEFVVTVSKEFV